jgi:hypothetical protein
MSDHEHENKTTYGLLMPGAGQRTPKVSADTVTVRVMERYDKDGTVTRKIGNGDWKPLDNPLGEPLTVRIDIDPEMTANVPVRQVGVTDNTITVERSSRGCLSMICGHCRKQSYFCGSHLVNCEILEVGDLEAPCCDWARKMFDNYFSGAVL